MLLRPISVISDFPGMCLKTLEYSTSRRLVTSLLCQFMRRDEFAYADYDFCVSSCGFIDVTC